jgi:hypothetical protein
MSDLNERIGFQVQGTARWRREKAEQFPDDRRNLEAAEELDRLATQIEALEGSELHLQIAEASERISRLDDAGSDDLNSGNVWFYVGEAVSEELRSIGFHTSYSTGGEFLEWYRDLLLEKLHDEIEKAVPTPSLDEQVANDPDVKAAKAAYDEVYAKALAEARKKL